MTEEDLAAATSLSRVTSCLVSLEYLCIHLSLREHSLGIREVSRHLLSLLPSLSPFLSSLPFTRSYPLTRTLFPRISGSLIQWSRDLSFPLHSSPGNPFC